MKKDTKKLNYLRNEIEHRGIYRVAPGNEKLPAKNPNFKYTWQFYLRRCMFDPKFISTAAELLIKKFPSQDVQITACEDAGVPLGMAISNLMGTPMLSVKKSRKEYGLLNLTEGRITGRPLLLVDDLAGSQITLRNAATLLSSFNLPLADFYATLVDKTQNTHAAYLHDKKLISLLTCDDFAMSWTDYVSKYGKDPEFGEYY